jgi:thioredoxin reductase (NADPH)
MTTTERDLVIVGGGPAGLTAGIYASRGRLDTILLEAKPLTGGQIATTDIVENYPGFPEPLSGAELMDKMRRQAERFGLEITTGEVTRITAEDGKFRLEGPKDTYVARAVIVATGTEPRRLGVPREDELWGLGVSTCATCDGALYRDRPVAVVGGGDSAVKEAVFLTKFANRVFIIHRRDELRAEKVIQEQALASDKIEFVWSSVVTEMLGDADAGLTGVKVKHVETEEVKELAVDCVFLYVGVLPNTNFVKGLVELDDVGLIKTDGEMRAATPGIFAAGDCRSKAFKQVATAVGEGAVAAYSAQEFITGGPYAGNR